MGIDVDFDGLPDIVTGPSVIGPMRVSRYLWLAVLSLGCTSRTLSPVATSAGSDTDGGSTGEESTEESTESSTESGTDTGDPVTSCTTEWDCGIGERCLEGACTCLGCVCQSPSIAPATIDAPDEDEDEVPVFLDFNEPECAVDADCDPLEFCDYTQCIETTACVEDLDCRADWPWENRFCVDGLCRWIPCDYDVDGDAVCPAGALCDEDCEWLDVVPTCLQAPSFDEVVVHTLDAPDTATFVILDVDLDARDDIVVLEGGFISWLTSTGVDFGPPTPWEVEPGTQIIGIAVADIHGDGVDELLVQHADPRGIEFLAAGASWPQWVGFAETLDDPDGAVMMDLDFDGLPDLVTGTSVAGPMTLVEAQLGDGTGTFGPLWDEVTYAFEFSRPYRAYAPHCAQYVGSIRPEDMLESRGLDEDSIGSGSPQVNYRSVAGHMFFRETPQHEAGFVATAPLVDRGAVFYNHQRIVEIGPAPGAIAFLVRDEGIQHALVDHGLDAAEFVEFTGDPFTALCRGSLGFALDAVALDVGDFDGDGREDLLSQGTDGVLRTWLSRD